jgi:hypothetical protein
MNPIKPSVSQLTFSLAIAALLCGCHKQETPPPSVASAPPQAAIVSAEKTSFDQVTAKLNKGGNFYLYLSTEQALSGLAEKIAGFSNVLGNLPAVPSAQSQMIDKAIQFADLCIKDSGIQQISGVGMSSIAREPGFYFGKVVVYHYPGQDAGAIWSAFGKTPHPLHELELLPENTVFAMFSDLDVPLVWTNVQQHLEQLDIQPANHGLQQWPAQFQKMTGLDFDQVLASLGGNYGIIFTLDDQKKISLPTGGGNTMEFSSPGLAIIAKVNSDVIFDRIDEIAKGNPLVVRVDQPDLKMRTMTIPLPLPVELRPSIARSGDYLLLASSDTLIQDILAVKAGKAKGFKSTAEFARLSQGIPEEGNNFSLVADRFVRSMMQLQQQTLTNKGTMTAAQVDALQHAFNSATNYGNYSVGVNGPEGWEGFANGSQSMQTAILPVIAGVGVAAAIAIPNFIRARTTSQQNACINNLRLLDSAKQQWALENHKSSSDTPTMEDLKPYLGSLPSCPDGGTYTLGSVAEKPACSVPGHVLP